MYYPPACRSDHVGVYESLSQGEVKVHDPYKWLEKPSAETDNWIDAQVSLSRTYLNSKPYKKELEKEFIQNIDYDKVCYYSKVFCVFNDPFPKFSTPKRRGDDRWYWYHNAGLQA
jgi:prolyl oligopeptidase